MAYIDDLNAELARLQKLPPNSSTQSIQRVQQQIAAEQRRLAAIPEAVEDINTNIGSKNSPAAITDTGNYDMVSLQKRSIEKQTQLNEVEFSTASLQRVGHNYLSLIYGVSGSIYGVAQGIYGLPYATAPRQDIGNTYLATLAGKDFSTQTTLAAVLAKIIAAPATEAKQDTQITNLAAILTKLSDGLQTTQNLGYNGSTYENLRVQQTGGGNLRVSLYEGELGNTFGMTSLRDLTIAQRYTVWADSLADGIASQWTQSTANGGTIASTGGEGLIQTSANASGSAQMVGPTNDYFPGQVAWMNSSLRCGDAGSAGNVRRWGVFTVSGTTPQNGFYYELDGTTLNAVMVNGGTPTATASTSWTRFSTNPFTMDANFHGWEIRFTANQVLFYIDNVLRHSVAGTTAPITATLNFPITIQSINSSGATNRVIGCRNIGYGRFGLAPRPSIIGYYNTNRNADYSTAQTGVALWTPASGKKICVTRYFIATNNTTEGVVTLWFGASGDTTFNSGTDQVVWRGTLTPTVNDKPYVLQQADVVCNNPDYILRVTTSANIGITVGVDGFEF